MIRTLSMLLFLIVVLIGFGWLLGEPLDAFALGKREGDTHVIVAKGWDIFLTNKLIFMPAFLIGVICAFPFFIWVAYFTKQADHDRKIEHIQWDHENKINALKLQIAAAQKQADAAETNAKSHYQSAMTTATEKAVIADQRTQQAETAIDKGHTMQAQAIAQAKQSVKEIEQAKQATARAEKKQHDAMHAAERHKRKVLKLETELHTLKSAAQRVAHE